jgi:hypothetical protein
LCWSAFPRHYRWVKWLWISHGLRTVAGAVKIACGDPEWGQNQIQTRDFASIAPQESLLPATTGHHLSLGCGTPRLREFNCFPLCLKASPKVSLGVFPSAKGQLKAKASCSQPHYYCKMLLVLLGRPVPSKPP